MDRGPNVIQLVDHDAADDPLSCATVCMFVVLFENFSFQQMDPIVCILYFRSFRALYGSCHILYVCCVVYMYIFTLRWFAVH